MSDCYYSGFGNGGGPRPGSKSWGRQGMLSFHWTLEPWTGVSVGFCPVVRISGGYNLRLPQMFIFYFLFCG